MTHIGLWSSAHIDLDLEKFSQRKHTEICIAGHSAICIPSAPPKASATDCGAVTGQNECYDVRAVARMAEHGNEHIDGTEMRAALHAPRIQAPPLSFQNHPPPLPQ